MRRRKTAPEIELAAAAAGRPPQRAALPAWAGEAVAMLVRRGLRPRPTPLDLPFPPGLAGERAEQLAAELAHYAFRLFLRGAIQRGPAFAPAEATRYVQPARARAFAEALVRLGLATRGSGGRYRLLTPAKSFGGTLEWYVARELSRRFGFDVAAGLKFHAPGVGGDLDVVAAAEGKLLYLELKSSPPKYLAPGEVAAFFDRVRVLQPDLALFVMDTALRLSDKALPMLVAELRRRRGDPALEPRRVRGEVWALTPHVYAVNARPDLLGNIGRALAQGLYALAPRLA